MIVGIVQFGTMHLQMDFYPSPPSPSSHSMSPPHLLYLGGDNICGQMGEGVQTK